MNDKTKRFFRLWETHVHPWKIIGAGSISSLVIHLTGSIEIFYIFVAWILIDQSLAFITAYAKFKLSKTTKHGN